MKNIIYKTKFKKKNTGRLCATTSLPLAATFLLFTARCFFMYQLPLNVIGSIPGYADKLTLLLNFLSNRSLRRWCAFRLHQKIFNKDQKRYRLWRRYNKCHTRQNKGSNGQSGTTDKFFGLRHSYFGGTSKVYKWKMSDTDVRYVSVLPLLLFKILSLL